MEVSITKLSENGQVVIPAEVRRDAGLEPSTKFLVFNKGSNIMLKVVNKNNLANDFNLLESIKKSEDQISKGQSVKANTSMSDEEIDDLLTK
ncbi:AbrB/MazE/SpoVT family DNA-binding domain-containing protein [Candidatus Woesearchaeota archaeon]|jgi:AbrB family looped-hinge helix DNA binding protein|nr:AbrB/MazE/SpoVT family DNA-binding domain-containing protein [Candidatus Woesearchaeota archaeon]MBT5740265.1 AbrB/MazE/SpoVT family DNA-binding domain-containing protein [Candidatus Woesearchaeota archaeon]